jgi:anti-anti-sigma regulatory factor
MFKMEARLVGKKVVLLLSGRMQAFHVEQLRTRVGKDMRRVVLDLEEVTLVDIDVVRFLCSCESQGIELRHCAPYIREWILRESARDRCES